VALPNHTTQEVKYVRRTPRGAKLLALLAGTALLAAACGSDSGGSSSSGTAGSTETTTAGGAETTVAGTEAPATEAPAATGGTITVGVEQEWDCADWMGTCGGSTYGAWAFLHQTMPKAFDFVPDGDNWAYKASNVLSEEPTIETSPKQVVTYKINPEAVWSDGVPITSSDWKYTWDQIVNGTDIYDTTGYNLIESVDDSDPATAVVTFKSPYASWKGLFGTYGIYPSHILTGKDRNAEMKDGYTFSAGPWKMESWNKGVGMTLIPNDKYWGDKPLVDKIEEKFFADTAAEFQAFKAGEVDSIGPQPQLDAIDQINAGMEGVTSKVYSNTGNVEALWINNDKAPFNDVAVRQAFGYAIDRDAIVKRLFGGIGVEKAVNSLNPPITAEFSNPDAWAGYTLDLAKVDSTMTAAGYAKGSDGIWAKDGQKVSFTIQSTAGNKRRELTEQVLQQQLKDAGFDMTIQNQKAGDLFGTILPAGDYQLSLYAQTATTLDPGLSSIALSTNIPTAANGNVGQNWQRINVPAADPLLTTVDVSLDDAARAKAGKEADDLLAADQVSLPLDPLPNIGLYGPKIKGDFSVNVITGAWWNMNTWSLAG
jgi:peptide/nickel transport system substrate-binding protein